MGEKRGRGRPPNLERRRLAAELRAQGLTLREIGHRLGVTHQAVSQMLERGAVQPPPQGRQPPRPWTPEELAQLGAVPDDELAAQLGRTPAAVRSQRTLRGIPTARDRRRRGDDTPDENVGC
jgi:hypothetical protein